MANRTVKVPSISCGHCVKTIEREVGELSGVRSVRADEQKREVEVTWDEGTTDWASIEALLDEIDYPPAG